jgi:hypothetical protein
MIVEKVESLPAGRRNGEVVQIMLDAEPNQWIKVSGFDTQEDLINACHTVRNYWQRAGNKDEFDFSSRLRLNESCFYFIKKLR